MYFDPRRVYPGLEPGRGQALLLFSDFNFNSFAGFVITTVSTRTMGHNCFLTFWTAV